MAQLIDGKLISQQIKDELKEEVEQFKAEGIDICLAVIQVGSDPASSVYVRNKKKACAYIGVESRSYELPEETSEEELIKLVEELNADESVNGILVQLPVPDHIDEDKIIRTISPDKDVDGFHPVSVGRLWIGEKGFLSCTPAGIIQLLKRSNISIEGKECVIIGRSNIVGKPMAALLLRENGTVTVAHSRCIIINFSLSYEFSYFRGGGVRIIHIFFAPYFIFFLRILKYFSFSFLIFCAVSMSVFSKRTF